jgi:hypothetical protein
VSRCVLVKLITNRLVPPAVMVEGVKLLLTSGRLKVIVSISAAVHVPVVQSAFVLETPLGTDIVAVLTTWVCASTEPSNPKSKPRVTRMPHSNPFALSFKSIIGRRLNTFLLMQFK